YVRAAVPPAPTELSYEAEEQVLRIGTGRISPVDAGAWEFRVGGVRMLELWFERRTAVTGADGLEAVRPPAWPQEWTSELLELITLLALLDGLRPRQDALAPGAGISAEELRAAGVLPVPASARRPASVLGLQEEGPDGQFALL
ncbi:DNA methyltransferase, partial [Streptomyces sp. SID11233]|nr:DNA methyltransferase [Streptomyces sp. SID11233]